MFCFEGTVLKNKTFEKCCLNFRTTVEMLKLARLELTGLKIANSKVKSIQKLSNEPGFTAQSGSG